MEELFELLLKNGDGFIELLNKELSMPNLPTPTMGGEVFWNTLANCNGWKLQQNMLTHHARIIDSNNVRRAWGTISAMETAMKRVANSFHANESSTADNNDAYEQLKKLKELYDIGIIDEETYKEKKNKYLAML